MSLMDPAILEDTLDESDSAWSRREAARLKQIQIGKARPEYQRYVREVPPSQRQPSQPSTPDPRARVSKRQFDRALGDWRRRLHEFDSVPRRGHEHEAGPGNSGSSAPLGNLKKNTAASLGAGGTGHRGLQAEGRGSAAGVNGQRSAAPRRVRTREARSERTAAKLAGRKPAEALPEEAAQQLTQPEEAFALSQAAVVRISLADQLLEMPQMSEMPQMGDMSQMPSQQMCNSWGWYEEAVDMSWSPEALQRSMVTPSPSKPAWDGRVESDTPPKDCYTAMPEESMMIPHKLFDDSPEKSCSSLFQSEGYALEPSMSTQPACMQSGVETIAEVMGGGSSQTQLHAVPPPRMLTGGLQTFTCPAPQAQPSSPRTPKLAPQEVKEMKGLQMSPNTGTPLPTTPRRGHWVPETPSPDRMYSMMMQNMMTLPFAHPPHAEFNPYFSMPHCG